MKTNWKKALRTTSIISATVMCMQLTTGCASNTQATSAINIEDWAIKSVIAMPVVSEDYVSSLKYKGYVTAKEEKKLSFGLSGKVKDVYVEKGQWVQAGDVIAEMDMDSIIMAINSAEQNVLLAQNSIVQIQGGISKINTGIEAEKINLKKLEESYASTIDSMNLNYEQAKTTFDNTALLYELGDASKQSCDDAGRALEKIEIELKNTEQKRDNDIALQTLNIQNMENELIAAYAKVDGANIQKNQAELGIEQYNLQLTNSVLTSPVSGYISDVLVKSGENTSFGAAVVKVQSDEKVIHIGVYIDDYRQIKTGMTVNMEAHGTSLAGHVSMIALSPDESSRTYVIEITPDDGEMAIGTLVDVYIPIESRADTFIPINSIIVTDGVNYVYSLEKKGSDNTYAVKKNEIHVEGTPVGDKVNVSNIAPGTLIVTEGVKDIKENDTVTVME